MDRKDRRDEIYFNFIFCNSEPHHFFPLSLCVLVVILFILQVKHADETAYAP